MKKYLLALASVFVFITKTKAQDGFEGYLLANNQDRSKLIEAYINPAMKGLIYGMNSGWYHTAKVHKTLGFDVSFSVNTSFIPSKDELFTLSGLTSINQSNGGSITAATVGGSNDTTPLTTVNYTENGITYATTFNAPGGIKEDLPLNAAPAAALQFNLGLPSKFEVSFRFLPEVGTDDVKGNLFGIGVKKEITNWFGSLDKLPLHVSLLTTYTNMNVDYTIGSSQDISISNGLAAFKLNTFTVQAIASLNFPVVNIYGGIGYGAGNSSLAMTGTYTLNYDFQQSKTITNPLDTKFNAGSFRTTAGIRFSLGFFKIFADYTFQEYNTANLGLAFGFR